MMKVSPDMWSHIWEMRTLDKDLSIWVPCTTKISNFDKSGYSHHFKLLLGKLSVSTGGYEMPHVSCCFEKGFVFVFCFYRLAIMKSLWFCSSARCSLSGYPLWVECTVWSGGVNATCNTLQRVAEFVIFGFLRYHLAPLGKNPTVYLHSVPMKHHMFGQECVGIVNHLCEIIFIKKMKRRSYFCCPSILKTSFDANFWKHIQSHVDTFIF